MLETLLDTVYTTSWQKCWITRSRLITALTAM